MAILFKLLGGILAGVGALKLTLSITDGSPATSQGMALGMVFFGLLVYGFGELCKTIAAIEVNTRRTVGGVQAPMKIDEKNTSTDATFLDWLRKQV